jgi:hypothetical protein
MSHKKDKDKYLHCKLRPEVAELLEATIGVRPNILVDKTALVNAILYDLCKQLEGKSRSDRGKILAGILARTISIQDYLRKNEGSENEEVQA